MSTSGSNKKPFFKKRKRPRTGDGVAKPPRRRRMPIARMKKGIFIVPSLLTLTGIFLGFYSMILAMKGSFTIAAALILVAAFFDGVDGKVARLTKTTTRFGLELDSLADVISFGVAPALLTYLWALEGYGRIGWVCCFVYVACGTLRLARFNVQSGQIDPKRFNGLPIPGAAAMAATTVLFFQKMGLEGSDYKTAILILTFVLAFFMVSAVKFHAFKDLGFAREKPFSTTVAFVLILALIAASPSIVLFVIAAAYVISGPILTLTLYLRNRKRAAASSPEGATEKAESEVAP
jgi:CDP-diacylglycerol--serine O-phosphatidyltransferase